jgi:hypothetical protein
MSRRYWSYEVTAAAVRPIVNRNSVRAMTPEDRMNGKRWEDAPRIRDECREMRGREATTRAIDCGASEG